MPFVEDKNLQTNYLRAVGVNDPKEVEEVGFMETMKATMQLDNFIVSEIYRTDGLPDSVIDNDNFQPLLHLTDEELLDSKFVEQASYADNIRNIEAIRTQYAKENALKQKMANGSGLAVFAAEALDFINFIPVAGSAYKTYRTGSSILSGALATSTSLGAAVTAEEYMLHQSQITREFGESAVNIGAATVFGAMFGAGAGYLKGVDYQKAAAELMDVMEVEAKIGRGENPTLNAEQNKSLSAAAAVDFTDVNVRGTAARAFIKTLGFSPLTRTITSESKATRLLSNELAENPLDLDRGIGQSIETKIKVHEAKLSYALRDHNDEWIGYQKVMKEQQDPKFIGIKGKILDGMNRRRFNEEVARAVRSGEHPNEFVLRAANKWNDKFYKPYLDELQSLGMLPKDIETITAKNYVNRVFDKRKIIEDYAGFTAKVSHWIQSRGLADEALAIGKEEADEIARDIAMRITASPDGRLPYDYQMGKGGKKGGKGHGSLKGVTKQRSFLIPDEMIDDFLVNDIEELGYRYMKAVAPDIELHKAWGDFNAENMFDGSDIKSPQLKAIQDDWYAKIEADPKNSKKLQKKMAQTSLTFKEWWIE
jgi:hypothetical protein